jgi:hypothetical protein
MEWNDIACTTCSPDRGALGEAQQYDGAVGSIGIHESRSGKLREMALRGLGDAD